MITIAINAILLAGYYAILATGLAFMYSVMKVINLAHGAIIVLSAYGLWILGTTIGVPLPVSILLMLLVMFLAGLLFHHLVLSFALRGGELIPILATFGVAIIIENLMFQLFGADNISLAPLVGDLSWASFELPGQNYIGKLGVYILVAAILMIASIEFLLKHTFLGYQIRAVTQDHSTSELIGIDASKIAAITAGIAIATGVIAAAGLGLRTSWGPYSGSVQLLIAFEVVVIGGIGSLWRVLAGALILAYAQSLGAIVHPQGFLIGGHIAFLLAVFIRLQGLSFRLKDLLTGVKT